MHRSLKMVAMSIALLALLCVSAPLRAAETSPVTAIDIVLEPDATMVEQAQAANKRLLAVFPKGFVLGSTHHPHISTLQRYVRTADLPKFYEAVGKVLAEEKPTTWKLEAYKLDYAVWDKLALTVILVRPTDELVRYQQKLIDAVTPYTVKTGTAAAFATTKADPDINQPTIHYVQTYVPDGSGAKFIPHVTVGVAQPADVKKMVDQKFDAFTFSPVGVAVYHLGNFGTARTELKSWDLKR